jgi:hypothetical protein
LTRRSSGLGRLDEDRHGDLLGPADQVAGLAVDVAEDHQIRRPM